MARAEPRVVVDANVLANIHVCDLLLRLAEEPALFLPLWSHAVLDEVQKTHQKLGWSLEISDDWRSEIQKAFPESLVTGWEHLLDQIQVDSGRRAPLPSDHGESIIDAKSGANALKWERLSVKIRWAWLLRAACSSRAS